MIKTDIAFQWQINRRLIWMEQPHFYRKANSDDRIRSTIPHQAIDQKSVRQMLKYYMEIKFNSDPRVNGNQYRVIWIGYYCYSVYLLLKLCYTLPTCGDDDILDKQISYLLVTFEKFCQEQGMLIVSAFMKMFFVLCYEYCFVPYDVY